PPRGNAGDRLQVYAAGYPARIIEALNESFPAVAHVLGAGAFGALVHRYIGTVALRSYNLNDAGAAFAGFLQTDPLSQDLPFLADLARLEWAVASAFHAYELPVFDASTTADWTIENWERVTIQFQPSVVLVKSNWPIREIWDCRDTPIESIDLDLRNRADRVLVCRQGDMVACESLDDGQATALEALLSGQTLGEVIAVRGEHGDNPESVAAWFAGWMSRRLIASCTLVSARD
ncbi:MAG TPA: DNA-binding domain-containing protein, partial [Candidatus Acidoferrales bacterium]|nr:DNA-binding domain-containing protein [Candidatus Acidoferrales bacterium]